VQQMQQQLAYLASAVTYAFALYAMHALSSSVSWHSVIRTSVVLQVTVQVAVYWATAVGTIRDQYFFLAADLVSGLGIGVNFVVATLSLVEMAPIGHEATVYGVVSALYAIAPALGRGIANVVFGAGSHLLGLSKSFPLLVDGANYIGDTPEFRAEVLVSILLGTTVCLCSLLLLPLVPPDATSAHSATRNRKSVRFSACFWFASTVVLVTGLSTVAIVLNVLSIVPTTSCWDMIGGDGCR
jgi:hypothetical protein